MEYRVEHDSMGEIKVPADRYWGAQTQRSLENFPIGAGKEPMPEEIIHAFRGAETPFFEIGLDSLITSVLLRLACPETERQQEDLPTAVSPALTLPAR